MDLEKVILICNNSKESMDIKELLAKYDINIEEHYSKRIDKPSLMIIQNGDVLKGYHKIVNYLRKENFIKN